MRVLFHTVSSFLRELIEQNQGAEEDDQPLSEAAVADDDQGSPPVADDSQGAPPVADDNVDLSTVSTLGELTVAIGNVIRSYRHQPNPAFNSTLTSLAVIAVVFVCGIGVGHYIGYSTFSLLLYLV